MVGLIAPNLVTSLKRKKERKKKQGKSVHRILSAFLFLNNEMGAVH